MMRNGIIVWDDELQRETHADLIARGIIDCDASCQNAVQNKCTCACRGKNHGKNASRIDAEDWEHWLSEEAIEAAYAIPELDIEQAKENWLGVVVA